ncbi:YSC84-related protein [Pelagibius sp. CAU 1746]|uniref:lipid-binding SYLF domain-containing protein n=1 Tax=Pelagibius sp. CAU 1746 TaxID=3140370 RepID=UPI00325BEDB2
MSIRVLVTLAFCAAVVAFSDTSAAEDAATIEQKSRAALASLLKQSPGAAAIAKESVGTLVFPEVVKGGLIIGGLYGEGALLESHKVTGYYETVAASIGLQAGIQKFGYAVFFLDQGSLGYLDRSDGWEIGTAPSVVVVDSGAAGKLTTTSARERIYVFFFDQKGLMAGLGIEGTKISEFKPE